MSQLTNEENFKVSNNSSIDNESTKESKFNEESSESCSKDYLDEKRNSVCPGCYRKNSNHCQRCSKLLKYCKKCSCEIFCDEEDKCIADLMKQLDFDYKRLKNKCSKCHNKKFHVTCKLCKMEESICIKCKSKYHYCKKQEEPNIKKEIKPTKKNPKCNCGRIIKHYCCKCFQLKSKCSKCSINNRCDNCNTSFGDLLFELNKWKNPTDIFSSHCFSCGTKYSIAYVICSSCDRKFPDCLLCERKSTKCHKCYDRLDSEEKKKFKDKLANKIYLKDFRYNYAKDIQCKKCSSKINIFLYCNYCQDSHYICKHCGLRNIPCKID